MADHDGRPLRPVGVNQPGGEPLLRELIHKPADCPLDSCEVCLRDMALRVVFADNHHTKALSGNPGIAKLPTLFGPLSLSPVGSPSSQPLSLACARWEPPTLRGFAPLDPRCARLLHSVWLVAKSRLGLAAARVPRRNLREPGLPHPLLGSTFRFVAQHLNCCAIAVPVGRV